MLSTPVVPSAADVRIDRSGDTAWPYTLSTSPHRPQISCASYGDALVCAGRLARAHCVPIWRVECGALVRVTAPPHRADVLQAIMDDARQEFSEMPGLRLTERQARRLLRLDAATCAALLTSMVDDGDLRRMADGRVMKGD